MFQANDVKSMYDKGLQSYVDGMKLNAQALQDYLFLQHQAVAECVNASVGSVENLQNVQSPKEVEQYMQSNQKAAENLWNGNVEKFGAFYRNYFEKASAYVNDNVAAAKETAEAAGKSAVAKAAK